MTKDICFSMILSAVLLVAGCGPRQAVSVASIDGVSQQIAVSEIDEGIKHTIVEISFNNQLVDRSSTSSWTVLEQNFNRFVISKEISIRGKALEVRRVFDAGVVSSTVTYQFWKNGLLAAAVPISF